MGITHNPGPSGDVVAIDAVAPILVAVPATANATGIRGQMALDASFAYFCIAANTWVRAVVASW